jgi:glutamine cyclotransferase
MKKSLVIAVLLIVAILVLSASTLVFLNSNKPSTNSSAVTHYTYTVVNTYPHDPNAFTEGLVYSDGFLYESTGLEGSSSLRRVDLTTGNVLQEVMLPYQDFGEGIAIVNNTIIQLNW